MTGSDITSVVVTAGGLGTRAASWAQYIPKEFYPVAGRPGIAHLLIAAPATIPIGPIMPAVANPVMPPITNPCSVV